MQKIACSVGILTFNSAEVLPRALKSLEHFDEIIVCDGGSTDGTLEIARAAGCIIVSQDFRFKYPNNKIRDFGGVRNQMLDAAKHDWFLYVDSDEYLSAENVPEIASIVEKNEPAAYWIPRKYVIDGKIIDCASTYPSKQMRLFSRRAVNRFIKTIHERIEVKPGAAVKTLASHMLVPISSDPKELRQKWKYYVELEVERRGGKISFFDWISSCLENAKISLLFAFRTVRNELFCRGTKMPLALEWERHVYHWNICRRFFGIIAW